MCFVTDSVEFPEDFSLEVSLPESLSRAWLLAPTSLESETGAPRLRGAIFFSILAVRGALDLLGGRGMLLEWLSGVGGLWACFKECK